MDSKQLIKYYENIDTHTEFIDFFNSVYVKPNYFHYANILDFIYMERILDSKHLINKTLIIDKIEKKNVLLNRLIQNMMTINWLNCIRNFEIDLLKNQEFVSKGKYGKVYLTNSIVIKYFEDKNNALQEGLIGEAINSLIDKTPNFVYSYGLMPMNINNRFEYPGCLTMEYIKGIPMTDWIKKKKKEKHIINIIYQLLYTIRIAYKYINFSHNDLHLSNIMIEEYDDYQILNYDNQFSIRSKYIAKIIDFSLSSCIFKDTQIHTGREDNKHIGIMNIGTPTNDCIKFICSIITKCNVELKEALLNSLSHLVKFNKREDIIKYKNRFCPFFVINQDEHITNIDNIIEKLEEYKKIKIYDYQKIDIDFSPDYFLETYKPFVKDLNNE